MRVICCVHDVRILVAVRVASSAGGSHRRQPRSASASRFFAAMDSRKLLDFFGAALLSGMVAGRGLEAEPAYAQEARSVAVTLLARRHLAALGSACFRALQPVAPTANFVSLCLAL